MQVSDNMANTYTRSPLFHPTIHLSYEQMFPLSRTSTLARHTLGALRLARSFLLLEDDYDVDWEVDWNEPSEPVHPHRVPLRRRYEGRRPGLPAPVEQLCISPVSNGRPVRQGIARASGETHGLARRGAYPEGQHRQDGRTETRAASLSPSGCDRHPSAG